MAVSYFAPKDLNEAIEILQSHHATILAGGTDYFPARGRSPERNSVLDITRIDALQGIEWTSEDTLRIGAAMTWSEIAKAELPEAFAGLKSAALQVGGVQIQNAGTIAGNLCNASPAADGVPPLLTLEAIVELTGMDGSRREPLADFLVGPRKTTRTTDEVMVALYIPRPPSHTRSAFVKTGARKYLVISIAMTSVLVGLNRNGRIDVVRIAVGACSAVASRLTELERDLIGATVSEITIEPRHLAPLHPISDVRADERYRLELVPNQIFRALNCATAQNG